MSNLTKPQEDMLREMIDAIINPTPYRVGMLEMLTGKGELLCQRLVSKGMMEQGAIGGFSISAAGWYYAARNFGLGWSK